MCELRLPTTLSYLLETGLWVSTRQIPAERVQPFAPGESLLCLYPPPFSTVAHAVAAQVAEFWTEFGRLDQIEPEQCLIIADFGLGSDAPILLDFTCNPLDPVVLRLRWNNCPDTQRPHTEWVKCANDFNEFVGKLGLLEGHPHRPALPGLESLPSSNEFCKTELDREGRLDSSGSFTIQPDRARKLLADFRLARPVEYVLNLVAAASLSGATGMSFTWKGRKLEIVLESVRFPDDSLTELHAYLLAGGEEEQALAELAIGMVGAEGLPLAWSRLQGGEIQVWFEEENSVESAPATYDDLRITLGLTRRPGKLVEQHREVLRRRCSYAPFPIRYEGELLAVETPEPEVEAEFLDEGWVHWRWSESSRAELKLVVRGVSFDFASPAGSGEASGLLRHDGLRKDLSQSNLVEDATYRDLQRRLNEVFLKFRYAWFMGREADYSRLTVRVWARELARELAKLGRLEDALVLAERVGFDLARASLLVLLERKDDAAALLARDRTASESDRPRRLKSLEGLAEVSRDLQLWEKCYAEAPSLSLIENRLWWCSKDAWDWWDKARALVAESPTKVPGGLWTLASYLCLRDLEFGRAVDFSGRVLAEQFSGPAATLHALGLRGLGEVTSALRVAETRLESAWREFSPDHPEAMASLNLIRLLNGSEPGPCVVDYRGWFAEKKQFHLCVPLRAWRKIDVADVIIPYV